MEKGKQTKVKMSYLWSSSSIINTLSCMHDEVAGGVDSREKVKVEATGKKIYMWRENMRWLGEKSKRTNEMLMRAARTKKKRRKKLWVCSSA